MAQVKVSIGGRSYDIACGEGEEERLAGLASHVDDKVRALAGPAGRADDPRLLAMASLLLADELWELRDGLAAERAAAGESGGEAERRAASLLAIAQRLERLAETFEAP